MRNMVDIDVILDEKYYDPYITIRAKEKNRQVENIIDAIENASEHDFPAITVSLDEKLELISQRDIVRIYTSGRKILLQTADQIYTVQKTLISLEEVLNTERFVRISQSEIINLYKVKCFEFNTAGTIGIEFENGVRSWVSRSRVKAVKQLLKKYR